MKPDAEKAIERFWEATQKFREAVAVIERASELLKETAQCLHEAIKATHVAPTRTLVDMLRDILGASSSPMSVVELMQALNKTIPNVKYQSVYNALVIRRDLFNRPTRGMWELVAKPARTVEPDEQEDTPADVTPTVRHGQHWVQPLTREQAGGPLTRMLMAIRDSGKNGISRDDLREVLANSSPFSIAVLRATLQDMMRERNRGDLRSDIFDMRRVRGEWIYFALPGLEEALNVLRGAA